MREAIQYCSIFSQTVFEFMKESLFHQRCALCGTQSYLRLFRSLPAAIFGVKRNIYRCSYCGGGCTVPAPTIDFGYYIEQSHYECEFNAKSHLYKRFANDFLNFAEVSAHTFGMSLANSRLLDIGAGRGWLVEQARLRGVDAVGVELNRANVRSAKRDGIPLYESLDSIPTQGGDELFDILTLSAVIEHVPEPASFLSAHLARLRKGGLVLVSQAAFDGLLPTSAPWLWYGWQPREHFWHFNEPALRSLLHLVGIDNVLILRTSLHHPMAWYFSPIDLIGRNIASAIGRLGSRLARGDQLYAAGVFKTSVPKPQCAVV
jgi:SAM-dependent methyltransferase